MSSSVPDAKARLAASLKEYRDHLKAELKDEILKELKEQIKLEVINAMLEKHSAPLAHLEYDANLSQNQSMTDTLVYRDKAKLVKENIAVHGQPNGDQQLLDRQLFALNESTMKSNIDG